MPICGDPSCQKEFLGREAAGEKYFLDETTGRVLQLVRHEQCADRYATAGSRLRRVSAEERKRLLSPASAMNNMLAARRRAKQMVTAK